MKIVTDYKTICADVLTLVKLIYFHNFLTVYLLSPHYSNTETIFSLFWIEFFTYRMNESAWVVKLNQQSSTTQELWINPFLHSTNTCFQYASDLSAEWYHKISVIYQSKSFTAKQFHIGQAQVFT